MPSRGLYKYVYTKQTHIHIVYMYVKRHYIYFNWTGLTSIYTMCILNAGSDSWVFASEVSFPLDHKPANRLKYIGLLTILSFSVFQWFPPATAAVWNYGGRSLMRPIYKDHACPGLSQSCYITCRWMNERVDVWLNSWVTWWMNWLMGGWTNGRMGSGFEWMDDWMEDAQTVGRMGWQS